ncbi:zinc-binding alcohol dehydrogenase family protein [Glaciihabitans sp. dw_435]|uniref:quinone oxidoreductase family protein n=1 Tax=Glaciihabitans sp. dw_435 TaxID=2720081 RepID=UPI001BD4A891|nr:zinc-binding alcohol dehydrogenase family protein [Glaciihabitans sp. dw_435]
MHAAVVSSFDTPPRYAEIETPIPVGEHEVLVTVIAAGLHPRVRSQADGSHYTSTDELPLVPGIDGVGRTADGRLVYFILPDTTIGAMAEQTVVDLRRSIVLEEGVDPVALAAAMNPAMSSWIALRQRIDFQRGQSVLVLGATGSAGQMAVQIAKHLGAGRVIAASRNAARLEALPALGADVTISLDGAEADVAERLASAAADVDVVLDYLWGTPTVSAMTSIVSNRTDPGRPLAWIEIGSVAGPDAVIPSAALRAARLQIVGSGQGSVSARDIRSELPALAKEISSGAYAVTVRAVPLADVEQAWNEAPSGDERIVITP